jgi:hypothetical protein
MSLRFLTFFCYSKRISTAAMAVIITSQLSASPYTGGKSAHQNELYFLENIGQVKDQYKQARPDIQYQLATGSGPTIFIGAGAIHYQFHKPGQPQPGNTTVQTCVHATGIDRHQHNSVSTDTFYRMDVTLVGANKNAVATPTEAREYYENYYTPGMGINGATAHTFGRVTYTDIYPGIDWIIYIRGQELKHEFVVHPGGKVSDIRMKYSGTTNLNIGDGGSLIAETPLGTITEHAPESWQIDGKKIDSRFLLKTDELTYDISPYSGTLVIDPGLSWATYYGGSQEDYCTALTTDISGCLYAVGSTESFNAIATTGAFLQMHTSPTGQQDVFILKLGNDGVRQWATYYGDVGADQVTQIATYNSAAVYVCGYTYSDENITTPGSHKQMKTGPIGTSEGYLIKFDSDGLRQWGTFFGGVNNDYVRAMAIDAAGDVYIGGETYGSTDIASTGTHQTSFAGGCDGFIAKFNGDGVKQWGTFYGGTDFDVIFSLSIDPEGMVYGVGQTQSPDGISTTDGHQPEYGGASITYGDVFLAKFSNSGTRLWGTYYGGTGADFWPCVYADAVGNVYLSGNTTSPNNITTPGSHRSTILVNNMTDGFLAKFDAGGTRIWGTYVGGAQADEIVTMTGNGDNIYIAGHTNSDTGICTTGAFKSNLSGYLDGFLAHFSRDGVLQYGTYFGGDFIEYIFGSACDETGNVYIGGKTNRANAIATFGAHDEVYGTIAAVAGGKNDGFIAKFNGLGISGIVPFRQQLATLSLYPNPSAGSLTVQVEMAGEIKITSLDGRVITHSKIQHGKAQILLPNDLSSGLYLCHFQGSDGSTTVQKFVYMPK